MIKKKILVDDTKRELCAHGSETFPMTVNHDDLWMFEGKNVPIHWHNELEISLPRLGKARYQVYQKNYEVHPGEGLLLNRNVPHSCDSTDDSRTFIQRSLCDRIFFMEIWEVMWNATVSGLFCKILPFPVSCLQEKRSGAGKP